MEFNRIQVEDAVRRMAGYEDTAYLFVTVDEFSEAHFDHHHADGTDHYVIRYRGNGNYSLEKNGKDVCVSPDHSGDIELNGCCDTCGTFASQEEK